MNPGNRLFGAQQIKKEILKVKDVAKVELSGIQNRTIEVDVAPMNTQRKNGVDAYQAIIESTVSRVRPVLMAAITTILGMIPLLFDVVSGGMAATIVFGLSFATLLTLFVTPALYSIFYYCCPVKLLQAK